MRAHLAHFLLFSLLLSRGLRLREALKHVCGDDPDHVGRCLALANRLFNRGYLIIYYVDPLSDLFVQVDLVLVKLVLSAQLQKVSDHLVVA